jgi:hypothetical protein
LKTLKPEEITTLLQKSNHSVYTDAVAIFDLCKGGFIGNSWEIARALGMSEYRFSSAINRLRQEDWMDLVGWTIPWVKLGPGPKEWITVNSSRNASYLLAGAKYREQILLKSLVRVGAAYRMFSRLTNDDLARREANVKELTVKHAIEYMEI